MNTVLVIAKQPVPGRVKTRLCPPCTHAEAAVLAAEALADTLDAVASCRASRRVVVLDGDPEGRIPPGFEVLPQAGGGLDQRLEAAFAQARGPAVLVGMDTPQITTDLIDDAFAALETHDAVLGPAADGGWWACGLRTRSPGAFLGVPMSTPVTGRDQLSRLSGLGLTVSMLPELRDVDDIQDAVAVASEAPATRFARRLKDLVPCGA